MADPLEFNDQPHRNGVTDALVLTHALEQLRARDGLTRSRLDNSRSVEAAPLLNLAAVRSYAAVHDVQRAEAAMEVTKECVRESLRGSQCIVADAILGLGTFSEAYARRGIDPRVVSALHSDLLGRRRGTLLSNWRVLHDALGFPPVEPPSDRALRGTIEREVLRELARQLIRQEAYASDPGGIQQGFEDVIQQGFEDVPIE